MFKTIFSIIGVIAVCAALYWMLALRDYINHGKSAPVPSITDYCGFTVSPLDTINTAPQGSLVVQRRVFKAIPFTDFPSTCSLTLLDATGNVHSLFVDGRGPHGSLCLFDIGDDVRTPSKTN